MGEWAIVILLACVTTNGISENKQIGLGVNPNGEIIIVAPPQVDIHLKPKTRTDNVYLMTDDEDNLYSIQLNKSGDKFVFFIHKLVETRIRPKQLRNIEVSTYKAVNNLMIQNMEPQSASLIEHSLTADIP